MCIDMCMCVCPVVMYNMTGATLNKLQINAETVTIIKYSR